MTALFVTVLLASLVGSLHCAGMCGAFVAFAVGAGDQGNPAVRLSKGLLLSLYQAGRLLTYAALGIAAGYVGRNIDLAGRLVGVQRAAAILAGAMMVAFGTLTLLRLAGVKLAPIRPPAFLAQAVGSAHRRAMRYSPPVRALLTGLLTTLLPCGFLYGFVGIAAGSGSALAGGAVMATFWLGTLPLLTFLGVGVKLLAGPLARRIPAIAALAIVAVGLYTIIARASMTMHIPTSAHGTLQEQVNALDHSKMPCCTPGAPYTAATAPAATSPLPEVRP